MPLYLPPASSGNTTYTSAYASPPGSPSNGDVWMPSDGAGLIFVRVSGAWVPYYRGDQATTVPNAASWTWYNQNSSTITDTKGGLLFVSGGSSSTNSSLIYKSLASATPYTLTACIVAQPPCGGSADWGLTVRESSSGKYQSLSYQNGTMYIFNWTNNTTVAVQASVGIGGGTGALAPTWFQIEDNGTNRIFRAGQSKGTLRQLFSISRTTFCTPDGWGFSLDNQGAVSPYTAVMIYSASEA
jgi:hypothetical protein